MITNIIEQLRRDEGEVLHAYQDKYGYWTIGVGRLIDGGKGGSISKAESALLLTNDITSREKAITDALPWTTNLDPVRRAVLTNMAFNMGVDGLLEFHNTLAMIRAGQFDRAAGGLLNSKAARQDAPARYARLAEQLKTGEWQ
jgi:lysozyme